MPDSISNVSGASAPEVFAADSAAVAAARRDSPDSVAASSLRQGIVLVDPHGGAPSPARADGHAYLSWVAAALTVLFCIAGLRYKSNVRYVRALLRETVEVRERHNMFDDTVRETSFMFLLMLLCAGSAGLLLYSAVASSGALAASRTRLVGGDMRGMRRRLPLLDAAALQGIRHGVCRPFARQGSG